MKLISMTEFVLQNAAKCSYKKYSETVIRYARFLRQPLTLGMFVPVDEEAKVLEKPKLTVHHEAHFDLDEMEIYHKAQEKVLFDGFDVCYQGHSIIRIEFDSEDGFPEFSFDKKTGKCNQHKTIEELCSKQLPLSPSALKQIGL